MSNSNIKLLGRSGRGRLLFCGGLVHATIAISSDWEMPNFQISQEESWTELNRGKLSKRDRRK